MERDAFEIVRGGISIAHFVRDQIWETIGKQALAADILLQFLNIVLWFPTKLKRKETGKDQRCVSCYSVASYLAANRPSRA